MYAENNLLFTNVEDSRTKLRYIEGKCGKRNLNWLKNKDCVMQKNRPLNPYNLPESYEEQREPYILPVCCDNILLISDLHIPYHNIPAVTIALDYGKAQKVNTIFINGDLLDCHTISKFESNPKKRSIKQEFDATREFLVQLRKAFPKALIYWLKGNHCIRWEKFLYSKVREIWDDDYFFLEERLQLNSVRVKILDDKVLVKAGKLSITHGHHIFKGAFTPVNPSRGAFLRAKQSLIVGHLHRPSHHPETDLDGKIISCWSTGCLCELRADYSPLVGNTMHGFAHIQIAKDGDYTVKNYSIIKGKLC